MKNKLMILFIVAGICLGLISCKNPVSENDDYTTTYKVEVGVISNTTYYNALNQLATWTEINYSKVASLRLYLYNNTISDHDIMTDVSLSDIKSFLLSKGMSKYEVEREIDALEKIGNDIVFGEYALDSNKKVWIYATK